MRWKWITAAMVIALIALAGWGLWERASRVAFGNAVEANGQLEFYNLISRCEEAEIALAKSMVANSPRQQVFYLTEVWNKASDAQNSLSELPIPDLNLSATRKFLSQLADYSLSLAKNVAAGTELTSTDRNNLASFQTQLGEFGQSLHTLESKLAQQSFRWANLTAPTTWTAFISRQGKVAASATTGPGTFADMGNIDRQIQQMPALTYDGPYSDHLLKVAPKGLTGSQVSSAEAEAKAVAFVKAAGHQGEPKAALSHRISGPIPAYSFILSTPDESSHIFVDVSETGGHIVEMLLDRTPDNSNIDAAEAVRKAQDFMKKLGFAETMPTYSIREDNIQTISFVGLQREVLVYPDMIKVKVALDNGEITGWSASSYLTNHHDRSLQAPRLTEAAARSKVNPNLKVNRGRLCVIPLSGGKETQAWEFSSDMNGDRFLVYINALTGAEEQILKLVNEPGGQLVM